MKTTYIKNMILKYESYIFLGYGIVTIKPIFVDFLRIFLEGIAELKT